jgi:hypothetical protein
MVFAKEGFAGFSSRCLTGTNRKVGVQTSMELQEAARNVVVQNLRLRALLQRIGVEATVVENWAAGEVGPGLWCQRTVTTTILD